ncbi:Hpt domain-containing protein [Defluviitalea raffinosedens]|uniref:Hpt domain-containing protein n=1 Tax=Defluviitalea raffinosedens TaxID=1450156 RepID=UPI00195732AF|nr:Hpt domain-containing protein [Defluviitalea raffinosedens]MBM7686250.1 hypothetical protein [Defluviitalea raffinosedens]
MDTMIQLYMEDTEEILQKAEKCLIRLEMEYSTENINELFRIAHTIKGSSQMVGYEDIGNVMHKIEDMLDCVRNGSILFDQSIVSLCFKGLDIVKQMLEYKKENENNEMPKDLSDEALKINEDIAALIGFNKKQEKKVMAEQPAMGIVSSLLNKEAKGRNKYYVTFFIDEDAPMVSPVLLMILKSVEDIGTIAYSSVTDSYFSELSSENAISTFDIILCTNMEEAELYTYFDLFYVKGINIVDLTRSKLEENDYFFNDADHIFYSIVLKIFIKLYYLLFNRSKAIKINEEEPNIIEALYSIEFLYNEAVNVSDKMKNKDQISSFMKDLNDFFILITKMYKRKKDTKEKLHSNIQFQMLNLAKRAYIYSKGKYLFRIFKPGKEDFVSRLSNFIEKVNKSATLAIFIDLSNLDLLCENEIKALIEFKNQLKVYEIEVGIIAEGPYARRIINIFDSIKPVEEFNLFKSEFDAVLGMLCSQNFCHSLFKDHGE